MSVLLPGRMKAYGSSPGKETEDEPFMSGSEAFHETAQRLTVAAAAGESEWSEAITDLFAGKCPGDDSLDEHIDLVEWDIGMVRIDEALDGQFE